MNNSDRPHEGHLTIKEFSVPAGGEWTSRLAGWTVIQIGKGSGYYLQPQSNQELETGAVLLVTGTREANIRASQLGELSGHTFSVAPARLTGIITLVEQGILKTAAEKRETSIKILPAVSPSAAKLRELLAAPKRDGLLFRLKLLQFFAEIMGQELEQSVPGDEATDARQRLLACLKTMPSSELLEMNFNELAQRTRCTSRHLGRIFHELVGMSFRDKRAAIRLERARELLTTTDFKIVDVALESGFKSLSLFNLMFARHFGVSPGKWRQKQGDLGGNAVAEKPRSSRLGNQLLPVQFKTNARANRKSIIEPRSIKQSNQLVCDSR